MKNVCPTFCNRKGLIEFDLLDLEVNQKEGPKILLMKKNYMSLS